MPSPAALERAGVHVVNQHVLVEEAVDDVQLMGIFIQIEAFNTRRQNIGLLIVLLQRRRRQ